jgi:hypothetical protein
VRFGSETTHEHAHTLCERVNIFSNKVLKALDGTEPAAAFVKQALETTIAASMGIPSFSLTGYTLVKELSMTTPGGHMRADICFVKVDPITKQIVDIVIVENKLNTSTEYTTRQKEGWNKIKTTQSMNLKFAKEIDGTVFNAGTSFAVAKAKCVKIADHGQPSLNNLIVEHIPNVD